MGQGADGRRSAFDQEHGHRPRVGFASGEDSLLGAGGRRDQGSAWRLEEKAGRAGSSEDCRSGFGALVFDWENPSRLVKSKSMGESRWEFQGLKPRLWGRECRG